MKYIRTKEELGIERDDGTCCFRTWVANPNCILKKDWLYADTIEELCDEFVCGDNYKAHCILSYEQLEESYWKERLLDNDKTVYIYGAIWTDKGLIYVAKMNEKGELELL